MLKSIIAVIAGVVAGALVVFGVEMLGYQLFPTPDVAGYACSDPATYKVKAGMAACMAVVPVSAKANVVGGWFLGALIGGMVALLIGGRWTPLAWIVAATIFLLSATTFFMFPHPLWMIAGAVFASLLGGFLATKLLGAKFTRPA
jgi:hypothetical protein